MQGTALKLRHAVNVVWVESRVVCQVTARSDATRWLTSLMQLLLVFLRGLSG